MIQNIQQNLGGKVRQNGSIGQQKKIIAQIKKYNKGSKLFPESTSQSGKHTVQFGFLP